jgi:acetoin utilization deacetylase AcuC-like enzyme
MKDDFEIVKPQASTDDDILLIHTAELLGQIKSESFYDGDSPAYANIYAHATLSAGAAVMAAEFAIGGTPAFSLMRPPGHHAGRNFLGGFCYFNNIAIATAKALKTVSKVAILDFDCHHGNGTQEIFMGHESVLYVSLHQSPLYPGTGFTSDLNCLNYPVAAGTTEDEYLAVFEKALAEVADFGSELIAVSAGFDTFKEDPITNIGLEIESYEKLGRLIASLSKPTFSILEGGYSRRMPQCVHSYLKGLGG